MRWGGRIRRLICCRFSSPVCGVGVKDRLTERFGENGERRGFWGKGTAKFGFVLEDLIKRRSDGAMKGSCFEGAKKSAREKKLAFDRPAQVLDWSWVTGLGSFKSTSKPRPK